WRNRTPSRNHADLRLLEIFLRESDRVEHGPTRGSLRSIHHPGRIGAKLDRLWFGRQTTALGANGFHLVRAVSAKTDRLASGQHLRIASRTEKTAGALAGERLKERREFPHRVRATRLLKASDLHPVHRAFRRDADVQNIGQRAARPRLHCFMFSLKNK